MVPDPNRVHFIPLVTKPLFRALTSTMITAVHPDLDAEKSFITYVQQSWKPNNSINKFCPLLTCKHLGKKFLTILNSIIS